MNEDLTQRVYTHKAVARFYNTEDYDKISIRYSGTGPYGNDTKIKIYGLTPDQLVNSPLFFRIFSRWIPTAPFLHIMV